MWSLLQLLSSSVLVKSSVQSLSQIWLFATPWTAALQASLSITNSWSLLKLMSGWCHPTISSSVVPFSSCLQSFPESGSFQMSQLFISGGQSIGISAPTSVLRMNTQDWSPLGWTGWISLQSKGLSKVFSNTTIQKLIVQLSHSYMTTDKTLTLMRQSFVDKVMSLLFTLLSRWIITFLSRSKCLLISWL